MWSCFRRLRDYAEALEEPGGYEIGVSRGCWFHHEYLGMSNSSVRARLRKHYTGRGNEGVADYGVKLHLDKMLEAEGAAAGRVLGRSELWMRWPRMVDPVRTEAQFRRQLPMSLERCGSSRHRTVFPGVSDMMSGAAAAEPRSTLATQPHGARSPRPGEA